MTQPEMVDSKAILARSGPCLECGCSILGECAGEAFEMNWCTLYAHQTKEATVY